MNKGNQLATKKCPFCAEEILADAVKCRYCGEWLIKQAAGSTIQRPDFACNKSPEEEAKEQLFGIRLTFIIGIVLFSIMVFVGITYILDHIQYGTGSELGSYLSFTTIFIFLLFVVSVGLFSLNKRKKYSIPVCRVALVLTGLIPMLIFRSRLNNPSVQSYLNYKEPLSPEAKKHRLIAWLGGLIGFLVLIIILIISGIFINNVVKSRIFNSFLQDAQEQVEYFQPHLVQLVTEIDPNTFPHVSQELYEILYSIESAPEVGEVYLYMSYLGEDYMIWKYMTWSGNDEFEGIVASTYVDKGILSALRGDSSLLDEINEQTHYSWSKVLYDDQERVVAVIRLIRYGFNQNYLDRLEEDELGERITNFPSQKVEEPVVEEVTGEDREEEAEESEADVQEFLEACKQGNIEDVKRLLEQNVDVNAKDNYGQTALMLAEGEGHTEIVEILIDNGADVNAKDIYGKTALMWAAINGHTEIVEILIDNGADVNAKDNDGQTALMLAEGEGHTEAAKLLIDNGADVNAKDDDGLTALMLAANRGHTEIVEILIDNGADVNAKDNDGQTALMLAEGEGHTEAAKLLIDNGADVNAKDDDGLTALMYAANRGYTETAEVLIDKGADVNVKSNKGNTALMIAAINGHTETVNLLREAGARE